MPVTVIAEGECCACCALKIVNDDSSSCRDYYGHTHPEPTPPVAGHLVIGDSVDETYGLNTTCDLCGRAAYGETFTYSVLGDAPAPQTPGIVIGYGQPDGCNCTDPYCQV